MSPVEPQHGINGNGKGVAYWRSLEHLADSPEMRELIGKEFPGYSADEMTNGSRRRFLKLAGASMALAGLTLTGCRRWPEERLAPYSTNPRDRLPGIPEQYATALELGGVAQPLLVTSFDGRPIKVEGNPSHPCSWSVKDKLGATTAFAQATLLEMYDPHRSRTLIDRTGPTQREANWEQFETFAARHFAPLKGNGAGLAVLCEATASPSVADMKRRLMATFPGARWVEYEPVSRDEESDGAKLAFGRAVRTWLHLDRASHVVLFDADVLGTHPAAVRYAADWVQRRRSADEGEMSRVYVAEAGFSLTGSNADVRLAIDPSRLYPLIRAVARGLGVSGVSGEEKLDAAEARFVESVVADLKEAGGNAVVAAGPIVPAAGHALAHAINQQIGAVGKTVTLLDEQADDRPSHVQGIATLATELAAGQIKTLLVLGGNPVYDAPADVGFAKALDAVPMSIRLGLYDDETSQRCKWHLPRAHYLESWGDARAWDGSAGIVQPLIQPLFEGRSIIELLATVVAAVSERPRPTTAPAAAATEPAAAAAAAGATTEPASVENADPTDGYQIVRRTWRELIKGEGDFDHAFRRALEAGVLPGSEFAAAQVTLKVTDFPPAEQGKAEGVYLRFEPDSHAFDGRFANNGWLQETPDPLTKLVWDNAALISKKDADKLGVTSGDMITIDTPAQFGHQSLSIAAYVLPGQPAGVVTLPLGYGRTVAGPIGDQLGFNTYALRSSKAFHVVPGAYVQLANGTYKLVATQDHYILDSVGAEGRDSRTGKKGESGRIVHEVGFAEYRKSQSSGDAGPRIVSLQLFQTPTVFNDSHAWGMAVDMTACIGCNACAVACQAENNIPVVGKVEADNHRAMNWIRIDRYYKGNVDDPNDIEVVYQPMMCQHCENAPCEQVCPVGATVHDTEGLNTMVYNRCIGTRYCSNNCPYKVRRFNYFDYHSKDPRSSWGMPYLKLPDMQQLEQVPELKRLAFNPDVTVRMRGVMEKCTYCVQRIHRATIAKRAEGSDVKDGDIVTACQQACPTQAIIFGNLNDRDAAVSRLHHTPRSYGVLAEDLDTRPRTMYLAKVRNGIEGEAKHEA